MSIPRHANRLLPHVYSAQNNRIRNLTCRYLVAKVRPQSQGISVAAPVAFASVDHRVDTVYKGGKIQKVACSPEYINSSRLIAHTRQSRSCHVSAKSVLLNIVMMETFSHFISLAAIKLDPYAGDSWMEGIAVQPCKQAVYAGLDKSENTTTLPSRERNVSKSVR